MNISKQKACIALNGLFLDIVLLDYYIDWIALLLLPLVFSARAPSAIRPVSCSLEQSNECGGRMEGI